MGWEDSNPYEYHPERRLYYHEVVRNLICGSQPQSREDIEHLKYKESVTNIINLQVQRLASKDDRSCEESSCVLSIALSLKG